ncbi:MAG: flavodoxin family protein [Deltaproteobacteria bacterium]|nr:flavodoxin family protein [Deltaproteobacteria bacterium]
MSTGDHDRVRALALACSPRAGGNSDQLLEAFVRGMEAGGAEVELVRVREAQIESCRNCGSCSKTGRCVIADEMSQEIHPKMERSDRIALATPVFFYQTSSLAAKVIERVQPFWARKHVLEDPLPSRRGQIERLGAWLAVGATRGERLFDGMLLTARYFYEAIGARLAETVTVKGVDERGAIRAHPTALADAEAAGRRFVELA